MLSNLLRPPTVTLSAVGFTFNNTRLICKLGPSYLPQWGEGSNIINSSSIYLFFLCVFWVLSITDLLEIMYFDKVYINFTLFQPSLFWKSKKSALISQKKNQIVFIKNAVLRVLKRKNVGPLLCVTINDGNCINTVIFSILKFYCSVFL